MRRSFLLIVLTLVPCGAVQGQTDGPQIVAIVNSASFKSGLPMGGGLATMFISSLPGTPGTYLSASLDRLPTLLANVSISINLADAPILAVVIPEPGQDTPRLTSRFRWYETLQSLPSPTAAIQAT